MPVCYPRRPQPSVAPELATAYNSCKVSWDSKKWIQDERYQQEKNILVGEESHTDAQSAKAWKADSDSEGYQEKDILEEEAESHTDAQSAKSWKADPGSESDMELDLDSGKEASLPVDCEIGQWTNWLLKWEEEKTGKDPKEASSPVDCEIGQWTNWLLQWEEAKKTGKWISVALSGTCCQDDFKEEENHHYHDPANDEETIKITREDLHCQQLAVASSETCCQDDKEEENHHYHDPAIQETIKITREVLHRRLQQLAVASSDCHRQDDKEEENHRYYDPTNEAMIENTREVLRRHRRVDHGDPPVKTSGKLAGGTRIRSPKPAAPIHRAGKLKQSQSQKQRGKAFSKPSKPSRYAKLDDKCELSRVPVGELRYSQLSCNEFFRCGRSVPQLVQGLLDHKVSLSEPFLRLTVFETEEIDSKTREPILRCIDNRRLFALKQYAEKSGQDGLMVNVNLFSQNTLTQCQRFVQNTDDTDGRDVRMRSKTSSRSNNNNNNKRRRNSD